MILIKLNPLFFNIFQSLNSCIFLLFSLEENADKKEWAIIELQGDLETRHPVPLSGKFIGDLHFTHKVRIITESLFTSVSLSTA